MFRTTTERGFEFPTEILSVWMTELGARNFWSEVLMYGGGLSVAEAQRAVTTVVRSVSAS